MITLKNIFTKRKITLLITVLVLFAILFCSGCSKTDIPDEIPSTDPSSVVEEVPSAEPERTVFPDGATVNGFDVSGLTANEAKQLLNDWVMDYSLEVTVNETTITYTAKELGISYRSASVLNFMRDYLSGSTTLNYTIEDPIKYDAAILETALTNFPGADDEMINAHLEYDSSKGQFVLIKEQPGSKMELDIIRQAMIDAILSRETSITVESAVSTVAPTVFADSSTARNALEKANNMLKTSLTYTYNNGSVTGTESIGKSLVASWLVIGEDGLTVSVSSSALNDYCGNMSDKYSIPGQYGSFTTTGGASIGYRVPTGGTYLDTDALYSDIASCISSGFVGGRTAVFYGLDKTTNFGGTYVEISLTSQYLWFYKNGKCVVSCSIVSGCVNEGNATPCGVFYLYAKDPDSWLTGSDFRSFVNYWMPFNGNIGMHDATWRGSFGGSIYKYSGSHGCINMPHSAAGSMFSQISVGTPVVVYGGTTSVPPLTQTISGTTTYNVALGSSPFKLNASPEYSVKLTYSSSNPAVATVSADGTVTPVGLGTAIITVTAPEERGYTKAELKVTINVKTACEAAGGHTWGSGVETTPPTCGNSGIKTVSCTVPGCNATKTETIAPTGNHSWDGGTETTPPTCGNEGVKTFTCTNGCGSTKTESIPATGNHNWNGEICTECLLPDPTYVPEANP